MPRQSELLPYICFAPEGELHGNCQNEPFSNDATFHEHGNSEIWIGYRHDLDTSYNGGMTFGQVLARAKSNLSEAMKAKPKSTKRAQWREAFPGFATKATGDITQQLQQGKRAFRQATCPSDTCKTRPEELLQMEWISIKCSVTKTEVFLIGFVFQLRGHEMIAICRNYSSSFYRFQRTDGSVSPDMFIRSMNPEPNPATEAKPRFRTTLERNLKRRHSSRLDVPDVPEDEDVVDGSPHNESSTTAPRATVGSLVQSSPIMSTGEPTQGLERSIADDKQEVASTQTTVGSLSTMDEYTGMINHICYTYGVSVLRMPNIVTHINTMEQTVREDNRLALCQSFAKIKTILVLTAADAGPDFLDEEYEAMISSAVEDFGVELLDSAEGVIFMESMGEAMVAGQKEYLSLAYASLKAYMIAYAG